MSDVVTLYPTTPAQWWASVDSHWENIRQTAKIVGMSDGAIANAEAHREQRNHKGMYGFVDRVWKMAPDEPIIHTYPSWSHICDLCSEYPDCFGDDA